MSRAAEAQLFGVRHHSPRACVALSEMLARVQPDLVLIEGPSDADAMIPFLTDAQTVPPIAILAYRKDGEPASTSWPFVAYSPELVALRWAAKHGKTARFIDIPSGASLARALAHETREETIEAPDEVAGGEDEAHQQSPRDLAVERAGFRTFEEFWEATFEAPKHDEHGFREAIDAFAELVRHSPSRLDEYRARDAIMRRAIDDAIEAGTPPGKIVAVLGAAHVAAIRAGDVDDDAAKLFEARVETNVTIIPYSFPRIAEQLGYGAGNRAPFFHQRAHDAGGDYRRATLEVLVDFTDHLRLRGFSVSLADTIEAYRLACMLSDMRGKSGPGLDEVREATIATLCRGESTHVDGFLWSTVVGKGVGSVAKGLGKNSLQEEFWHTVTLSKLPRSDEQEAIALRLSDAVQLGISVFLHRLRVLDVPYAALASVKKTKTDAAAGLDALSRVREAWQCQWTPSTEIALVERIVLGESLAVATDRRLGARLLDVKSTGEAADVLVDAVVTNAMGAVAEALAASDRLSALDDDVPSLAKAARALAGLSAYGTSRGEMGLDDAVVTPLLTRTFARATLRLPYAAGGPAEEADGVIESMRVLQDIALTRDVVDRDAFVEALAEVARSFSANPRCSGAATGLLVLARLWGDDTLADSLRLRLTSTIDPARTADFLAGLLAVNALALVKNRAVIALLDAYLQSLDDASFRDAAPMLRRALADLGKTERRYLVETVIAVRGHAGAGGREAATIVTTHDEAQLRAASDEIAKAMDDLDDLL